MTDLEKRLTKALKAIDHKGRVELKKLTREVKIAEDKLRKATEAVYIARDKLARANRKVNETEVRNKIEARMNK